MPLFYNLKQLYYGRGDPTISMSCSDKIAKWLILGIQGSLLSALFDKPIYLKAIVVAK